MDGRGGKRTGVEFNLVAGVLLACIYVVKSVGLIFPLETRRYVRQSFIWPGAVQVLVGLCIDRWSPLVEATQTSEDTLNGGLENAQVIDRPPFAQGEMGGSGLDVGRIRATGVRDRLSFRRRCTTWSRARRFCVQDSRGGGAPTVQGASAVGFGPDPSCSAPVRNPAGRQRRIQRPRARRLRSDGAQEIFTSFADVSGESAGDETVGYCPALTLISEARLYGVAFILGSRGTPAPKGSRFVVQTMGITNSTLSPGRTRQR